MGQWALWGYICLLCCSFLSTAKGKGRHVEGPCQWTLQMTPDGEGWQNLGMAEVLPRGKGESQSSISKIRFAGEFTVVLDK